MQRWLWNGNLDHQFILSRVHSSSPATQHERSVSTWFANQEMYFIKQQECSSGCFLSNLLQWINKGIKVQRGNKFASPGVFRGQRNLKGYHREILDLTFYINRLLINSLHDEIDLLWMISKKPHHKEIIASMRLYSGVSPRRVGHTSWAIPRWWAVSMRA